MRILRSLRVCVLFCALLAAFPAAGEARYPDTVSVLQVVLQGELTARARYDAYARQARVEKYPRLGYFSQALGASESIHIRNFEDVLKSLGVTPDLTAPEVTVGNTQSNLKIACSAEMEEIDTRYPQYLKKITPEGFTQAITFLTYAWESEKAHRDLISKLIAGSGLLFGLLTKTFEDTPVDYYVCQNCGSIVAGVDLPRDTCPICTTPVSSYTKVPPDT